MRRIEFFFFDAGGGHRSAATALKTVAAERKPDWDIRLVNLQVLLDEIDVFRKVTGLRLEDIYNTLLMKGWTLGTAQMLAGMHLIVRILHSRQVRILERHWRETAPEMVVSLIPNFNRALFESLGRACPGVPFVTILTDLADYPPHFWLERQDQYVICGTEKAAGQAREHGLAESKIFRTSGMILRPRFYTPVETDRAAGRRRLGLDPGLPTGLLLFGGQGSSAMLEIARRLDASGLRLQLILIAGYNVKLMERLREMKTHLPVFVEGFTREIPYYMHLADFLIGKPGPGSISEALAMGLPVIVEKNAWTLPQERFNADWVVEKEVGVALPNFRRIGAAVRELLEPSRLARYRANAAAIHNRAVFEIPEILEQILERGR
jgi:1,2-diacylglycerol 3-beta-galactosyltransferase